MPKKLILDLYEIYLGHPLICTDSRKITQGCIYFALKGDSFDGNIFAAQSLTSGAAYAVIDDPQHFIDERTFLVQDVLTVLQQLANHHRHQLNIPFIAITGTNGKTTTKELLKSVLSVKYQVLATRGNLNNHIGVPLTILSITSNIEIAVIEMGANHQQEIKFLCEIAEPDLGLITNVGKAHLEGFGGFIGVKKAKGELYDYLLQNKGLIFVNRDNDNLLEMIGGRGEENISYYSSSLESGLIGQIVENNPYLVIDWMADGQKNRLRTNLTGPYNLENILAAVAIARNFNLSPEEINKGITAYIPENNRSQITKTAKNTIICDFYNANPSSMQAAIENFSTITADKKILILGDMFELGEDSLTEHREILEKALTIKADQRIFIGEHFSELNINEGLFFNTTEEAVTWLSANQITAATILIKGSRGMGLERLLGLL